MADHIQISSLINFQSASHDMRLSSWEEDDPLADAFLMQVDAYPTSADIHFDRQSAAEPADYVPRLSRVVYGREF